MKITAIETIAIDEFPNILFVQVETDGGVTGLGETFFGPRAVAAYIHETAAPILLGHDPLEIDRIGRALQGYVGYRSAGAEMRGNSAIDIALWDIFGKATGQPVYQLLGGKVRDDIHIYNTCAGYRYIRSNRGQASDNWGTDAKAGAYEDLDAFLNRADELAVSLLDQGIIGMKIWPFDVFAERSNGTYISGPDLEIALEPFRKIREAVGNRIDIMVELHGLWNLPTAKRIFEALEPYDPYWFEDPLRPDNIDALAELARSTRVPIAVSETLSTRNSFRELFVQDAAGIAMVDISWCGGISEARKIATMAEAFSRPVMFHDCTGPVVFSASTHLSLSATNALVQESVRAFYTGWYTELVTQLPVITNGRIVPPSGPGIGTELLPELRDRSDVTIERSEST
ncbi:MAG: mandelate racemase/muconate lactonizing enzyme family protein [Chloroflexota bacterium]|nr:mandelate racemase/muconate lactonizing enzyme family protein [Chloroflexota bacterium]